MYQKRHVCCIAQLAGAQEVKARVRLRFKSRTAEGPRIYEVTRLLQARYPYFTLYTLSCPNAAMCAQVTQSRKKATLKQLDGVLTVKNEVTILFSIFSYLFGKSVVCHAGRSGLQDLRVLKNFLVLQPLPPCCLLLLYLQKGDVIERLNQRCTDLSKTVPVLLGISAVHAPFCFVAAIYSHFPPMALV